MQKIVFEKPYKFIPPHRGDWWPAFIRDSGILYRYLKKHEGVTGYDVRHTDRLRASLDAGHGIILAPNHSRASDPLVIGRLTGEAKCLVWAMASWHLFNQSWAMSWAIRKLGAFSLYREGDDRVSVSTAINMVVEAKRPLVLFPEGATTRTNDQLHTLLPGVAAIARLAAKKRARTGGKVVIHPVGIKYLFGGDLKATVAPVLAEIEQRLSWQPQVHLPLLERIRKLGSALLTLKEVEYFGAARSGSLWERQKGLIERLLDPMEEEYFGEIKQGGVVARIKDLRIRLMPEMIDGSLTEEQRQRRWLQLADLYLSQQVSCYPLDYIKQPTTVDRILETVERFEEDLTDVARIHGHMTCVIDVGEPIEVPVGRDRNAEVDPIMVELETALTAQLAALAKESPLYEE
ncbi:1-acyl-sn-glycerol-3-phosphate acyltransferase [Lignipirellula cremea]|uniref:Acyltransferase n=1 Tax=Lignipirellula cremea TaxID=2528010 RepID=A0A518DLZ3_9BACT|nr:1-acyl-sn-glycerol-3-phosphate acyltransferase [Lignipirellula cremea]QDU92842.1 Acyltransferase [Lignipirellula cremea]